MANLWQPHTRGGSVSLSRVWGCDVTEQTGPTQHGPVSGSGLQRRQPPLRSRCSPRGSGSHTARRRKPPCGCPSHRSEELALDVPATADGSLASSRNQGPPDTRHPPNHPRPVLTEPRQAVLRAKKAEATVACMTFTVGLCNTRHNTHARHRCKHANKTGERPGGQRPAFGDVHCPLRRQDCDKAARGKVKGPRRQRLGTGPGRQLHPCCVTLGKLTRLSLSAFYLSNREGRMTTATLGED